VNAAKAEKIFKMVYG